MFWESFIKKTSNFARVFHSGIGVLAALPIAVMIHPSMKHQRTQFLIDWCFGTLFFLIMEFAMYLYRSSRNNRQQMTREKKLSQLSLGTHKFLIMAAIQFYAIRRMEKNPDYSPYRLLDFTFGFATMAFCSNIVEHSYMCKFPERYIGLNVVMALLSLFVVVCTVFECQQVKCVRLIYFAVKGCLVTDLYMINFHPSEIHFLGDFFGKRVVCKDTNGNEYKGDFVSVEDDISTSRFMRLVLKNVEKETDGKFVPHAGSVYVDEISSLQLADDAAILM